MNLSLSEAIPAVSPEWCDIFNSVEFFNLHKTHNSFYLSVLNDNRLTAVSSFTETEPGVFKSPYRGTYGCIDFEPGTALEIIENSVKLIGNCLKEKGAKKIIILSPPSSHNLHQFAYLYNVFCNYGFKIEAQEINHTLVVDSTPLIEKMMRNNKKRLKKCERENFIFKQVDSLEEYQKVYSIIETNRKSKGFFISMTFDQIMEMKNTFGDKIFFFKTSQNGMDVASSICIKLNPKVLYVFYWGDLPGFEQYSPVAHLANGLYDFAQQNNFGLMDAGTSSINGKPNYGVCTFKENLGFTASSKLIYTLNL